MFDAQKYINEYNKNKYERLAIRLPKSKKVILEDLSQTTGKSINRLVIDALEKQYHIDLTIVESELNQSK